MPLPSPASKDRAVIKVGIRGSDTAGTHPPALHVQGQTQPTLSKGIGAWC